MRIVIVNAFERGNRGDAALLSAMIEQATEAYPGAELAICGFEDPRERPEFDGIRNLGSIRRWAGDESVPPLVRHARKLQILGVLAGISAGLGRRAGRLLPAEPAAELSALAEADLVISLGGGYLRGSADLPADVSVGFLLLPLWIADRFGVPVVAAPQSYGPFPTRFQKAAVRRVLARSRVISAREDISVGLLQELGVPAELIRRDVDSAFAFTCRSERAWRKELGITEDETVALFTARQYLAPEPQATYEQALAQAIGELARDGVRVVMAPQVTCAYKSDDDRIVQRRIVALADHPSVISIEDDSLSHHDVMALYSAANYMVGARFHSVIFSLLAHVPCIAISYERKGRGIMRDLDLERWVIDMSDVTGENLTALIERLRAAEDYPGLLDRIIPDYRARAGEFTEILRGLELG